MTVLITRRSSFLPPAPLRTFYVDATGGNDSNPGTAPGQAWQTVAKVNATALRPGDGVLFKAGQTWSGTTLTPRSGSAARPILYGRYGGTTRPIISGGDTAEAINVIAKHHVWFRGIRATAGLEFGFQVSGGSHHIILDDCEADTCGNDNIIFIDGCHDCLVKGGLSHDAFERVAGPSITNLEIADDCHDITIDGIELYGSAQYGLSIHAHIGERLPHNIVVRNTIVRNNTQHGIQIFLESGALNAASPAITLDGCQSYANTGKGLNISKVGGGTTYPAGVTVQNCTIRDNTATGTYAAEVHGANHTFRRNVIEGATDRALGVADATALVFEHNTVHVVAGTNFIGAVVLTGTANSGVTFRNNIVSVGTASILVMQVQTGAGVGFVADRNLYHTPSGAAANRWSWNGGANTTFANWKSQSGQDANSPAPADPTYTDAANNNYTLQAASPAIDAGVAIAGVNDGFLGVAPDCGAFEKA